jgi:hypothetical protein
MALRKLRVGFLEYTFAWASLELFFYCYPAAGSIGPKFLPALFFSGGK